MAFLTFAEANIVAPPIVPRNKLVKPWKSVSTLPEVLNPKKPKNLNVQISKGPAPTGGA